MFDTVFSDVCGIQSAIFSVLAFDIIISLARDIGFKCRLDLERPFQGIEHNEKEMQTFPSILEKKHFYWTDFVETWIRATTQSIQVV